MALSLSGIAADSLPALEVSQELREQLTLFYQRVFEAGVRAASRAPGNSPEAPANPPAAPADWVNGMKSLIANKMSEQVFTPLAKEAKRLIGEAEKKEGSWSAEDERQAQILPAAIDRAEYFATVPAELETVAASLRALARSRVTNPLSISVIELGAISLLDEQTFGAAEKELQKLTPLIEGNDAVRAGQALLEREVWGLILRSFETSEPGVPEKRARDAFAATGKAYVRREAKAQGLDPEKVLSQLKAQAAVELSQNTP